MKFENFEKTELLYLEVLREMYENNNPNCDNKEILMDWCLKQAEQGHVLAQFYIGWLYSYDPEHLDDARFWLEKADAQGNIDAIILLDKIFISDLWIDTLMNSMILRMNILMMMNYHFN